MFSAAGVRSFGIVGVLIVIWLVFQVLTSGIFLTPRNLTNLSGQVATTAILASGIVLVMVPAYIDLSVGATVAFCAVVAAMTSSIFGFSMVGAIAATLLVGLLIGTWHALWVAWLRVPAFIVTLASLLAVRGLSLVVTSSETISPSNDLLIIADGTLPAFFSAAVPFVLWFVFALLQVVEFRARREAGIASSIWSIVLVPSVMTGMLAIAVIVVALSYRGIPIPLAILLAVFVTCSAILRYTAFGRHLYAIGGNPQAAELAGIDIRLHSFLVMAGMGVLYGVAALVVVSRLDAAPPGAEVGLELNVIAAAVIGGTSLLGGRGTVGGAVIGALLMESLSNGMSLMNLPSAFQSITVGLILLVAVYADIRTRGRRAAS